MKVRNENDEIIAGQHMEVAVKEFAVSRESATAKLPQFMREVFLQKNAQHPCIAQTLGAYWPDPEEVGDEDQIEPCIIRERMTCHLEHVQYMQLLESYESKRRMLGNVAACTAHLHSHGIVHRDIKPENARMRIVDGQIIGRAEMRKKR